MGAWATYVISCSTEVIGLNNFFRDVIGPLQCDALGGQTMPAKNGGQSGLPGGSMFCLIFYFFDLPANFQAYCYEMKVIQAFSWALFIMFVVALWILFQLAAQAERFGRYQIWREPIRGTPP